MSVIREDDVIASVADALQYISYYHMPDFIRAMGHAHAIEKNPAARDAIAQILTNSRLCAEGHRPICQDTGIVVVFVQIGMGVRWDAVRDLDAMINEGVPRAHPARTAAPGNIPARRGVRVRGARHAGHG